MNSQNFELLNSANIVLLPKKQTPSRLQISGQSVLSTALQRFSPNSLQIDSPPLLDSLVSNCQSAFIKKRSIHDNFLYIENTTKSLHKLKMPDLFIKLDIHKAFATIGWSYLLDVPQALGFGNIGVNGCPSSFARPP
jgi:hypothetical protein